MRAAILHDEPADNQAPDAVDNAAQVQAVAETLADRGDEVVAVPCSLDLGAARSALLSIGPDVVVNLVESIHGKGRLIHLAAELLASLGVDHTGSPAEAIYLTSNKLLAKRMLGWCGIPTPAYCTEETLARGETMPGGTVIVKSVWEHASIGLDGDALISPESEAALRATLVCRAPALGGDAFAERYIDGREFNVSLLEVNGEVVLLPPAEIRFIGFAPDKARIVDYRAKWDTDSFEYRHTVRCFDFSEDELPLLERLGRLALECWRLFGLRGYARVDFRVDAEGNPFVLEVNANPCISPDAGFAAAAAASGIDYHRLVGAVVAAASLRPGAVDTRRSLPMTTEAGAPQAGAQTIRSDLRGRDAEVLRRLLIGTGAFSPEEVHIAMELIDLCLRQGAASGYRFLICEVSAKIAGFICFGPIPGTRSSFDVYWIATDVAYQGQGVGRRLMAAAERQMRLLGATRVFIDTSARTAYHKAHRFYERAGYVTEAVLGGFYAPGDDKVIYAKAL